MLEDVSGMEPSEQDWASPGEFPETFRGLLAEVGRYHAPFLVANADAIERKAERVETEIAGRPWVQTPFPYQLKCLRWLRASYGALDAKGRATVDEFLDGTSMV